MDEFWNRILCNVYCGEGYSRKDGIYLGGHSYKKRPTIGYFRCTTVGCCNSRPVALVEDGGCLFTGAEFEKHADRGLSRKPKTSIRTVLDGRDVTLEKWLEVKGKALRESGEVQVGARIKILWQEDKYYLGRVEGTVGNELFQINYDDGDKEVS